MYLIDTHTHIYTEEFDADREDVIKQALEAGVGRFFLPNIDLESVDALNKLTALHPDLCFPMMGLHPTTVDADYKQVLNKIQSVFESGKFIAVGEIGIDLYWDKTFKNEQIEAFETQLQWSIDKNLPVSVHTREAFPEVFASIEKVGKNSLKGVFHSFGGSREELEKALTFDNFMLGINGTVTYKNAKFREYLSVAPIERIILETDAPYLPPTPHRGERNEPSYLPLIAANIAEVYNLTTETVVSKTTENAEKLFG